MVYPYYLSLKVHVTRRGNKSVANKFFSVKDTTVDLLFNQLFNHIGFENFSKKTSIWVKMNSNQTVPTSVFTKLNFNSIQRDDLSEWSAVNCNFVPRKTGIYLFNGAMWANPALVTGCEIDLYISNVRDVAFMSIPASINYVTGHSLIKKCFSGSSYDLRVYHSDGVDRVFEPNFYWTWLNIERIG